MLKVRVRFSCSRERSNRPPTLCINATVARTSRQSIPLILGLCRSTSPGINYEQKLIYLSKYSLQYNTLAAHMITQAISTTVTIKHPPALTQRTASTSSILSNSNLRGDLRRIWWGKLKINLRWLQASASTSIISCSMPSSSEWLHFRYERKTSDRKPRLWTYTP